MFGIKNHLVFQTFHTSSMTTNNLLNFVPKTQLGLKISDIKIQIRLRFNLLQERYQFGKIVRSLSFICVERICVAEYFFITDQLCILRSISPF